MKRDIYLVRHGETEFGCEKRYLGHTDCKLSKVGISQARHLAELFSDNKIIIHSIFSSDLTRCSDTIKIVFPKRDIIFLKQLREINMGIWDGLLIEEVRTKYPDAYQKRGENIADFAPELGESFMQCQKRANDILSFIIASTKGNIVICSHAGLIRVLLCSLLKLDINHLFHIKQNYGCINILSYAASSFTVEKINQKGL